MTNNSSVETNASQWDSYLSDGEDIYTNYFTASVTLDTIFIVAGTPINVWILAAMLLSREIRSRMRNKIICGLLVINLAETLILLPISAAEGFIALVDDDHILNCLFFTVQQNIYHIIDFVGNWYIFILVCVYTAQILTFEPMYTPLRITIITTVIITTPYAFALLFVPLTMKSYFTNASSRCSRSSYKALVVYTSLDTIVPQVLASLLLMATAVLRKRRYPYSRFSTLSAQLTDDRAQTDPWRPFVALLVTAVASDFSMVVVFLDMNLLGRLDVKTWAIAFLTITGLSYLRVILLPLMLLLFPDIRERIKTWRPCRRSAPSPADLVVTYEKNTS